MLSYRKNNILFRIVSAAAISKFKEVQASSFIQINRQEFQFDVKAKESLLLEYDRFSLFITALERMLLLDHDTHSEINLISITMRELIVNNLFDTFASIQEIYQLHHDVFSHDIIHFIKMIHQYSRIILSNRIKLLFNNTSDKIFSEITSVISDYLQHLLCALHEYDNNLIKRSPPIISNVQFNCVTNPYEILPIVERAKYFVKLGTAKEFTLKNYSQQKIDPIITKKLTALNINLIAS